MNNSFLRSPFQLAQMLLCATFLSLPALAQQAPPSADTFSFRPTPQRNYGNEPQLAVTRDATSFLQFNLSGIPANATVSKATLRLYVDAVTLPGAFDAYELDTPWTERALNFTNAPVPGQSATGSKPTSIDKASREQFVLVDITSLVQSWVNGTVENNGLALGLTSPDGGFSFDSKESDRTSHEPELEITLVDARPQGPQGAQGPTGPQGPQGPQGPAGAQGIPGNLVPGSPLYIQNGTATQTGASFNLDGNGTVGGTLAGNSVNSTAGFQIHGITEFNANTALGSVMIGNSAGNSAITGGANQLIGDGAGESLTSGNADVFLGTAAGQYTTTGNGDVYVGLYSGWLATTGAYNTFLGAQSSPFSTTASHNTMVGFNSGFYNTTGSSNLFLGDSSGVLNTTGSNNIYLSHVGVGTESNTTRIGASQTNAYIAGIYGASVSSGKPVFVDSTGHLGTSGGSLSVTGTVMGSTVNTTGGYQENGTTILNQDGLNDTMIGAGAGNNSMTGGDSQFIGRSAGAKVTSGNADVFIGGGAGSATTTGNGDVYIGWVSGASGTTAAYNTFLGAQTGFHNTTGTDNLYLGFSAGVNNSTGSGNIYLAHGGMDGESNTIRIGGGQQAAYMAGIYGVTSGSGVPVYINSDGQLGTLTSSRKYKEDIANLGEVSGALMKLRPVTFYYKREYDRGPRTLQYGLIAEEVAKVFPELVAYNPDGSPYTVRYQYLPSILLSAFQEQYRKTQKQATLIEEQQQRIDALEQRLARIESMLTTTQGTSEPAGAAASISEPLQ